MSTAVISDLHLGAGAGSDLLRRPELIDRLLAEIGEADRLVLLGDTIELRDGPIEAAVEAAQPLFERLGASFAGSEIVLVPGNHDHRLLGHWLERRPDDGAGVALDEEVRSPHPYVGMLKQWLGGVKLTLRYPGVWLRDDVYATHGHYADSHLTLPTIERLSIAAVDRLGGRPTGGRSSPEDYEKVHAPIYDLLFDLAQGARSPGAHSKDGAPSLRVWELVGGATGRARNWRGRLLRSTVIPATLRGLERTGFGRFGSDFSLDEIGRSGVAAMHDVIASLGIEAEHVLFGHIHRRGPLEGEDGRSASDPEWERAGTTLHNSGCWLYAPAMLRNASARNPFWPGRVLVVGEQGPPEPLELLADAGHAELVPPAADPGPG